MALAGIRGVLLARRRKLAEEFAPAEADNFIQRFTKVQDCIDALDRAIADATPGMRCIAQRSRAAMEGR